MKKNNKKENNDYNYINVDGKNKIILDENLIKNEKSKKSKNHNTNHKWIFIILSLILFFFIHYFTSVNFDYQNFNSYNSVSKIMENPTLFEHEYTRIEKILISLNSILSEEIMKIFSILFLILCSLIVFLILEELKIEKTFVYLSYTLSLFMTLGFYIDKIFSFVGFELFLFLTLILLYIKSLKIKKNIYYFISLLIFSLIISPYFFILVFTIFLSYFLSNVFDIKTTRFQREISILLLILSISIFTLFYYNVNINFHIISHSLKLYMIIPFSIIGLIYAITNTKDLKFNPNYIFIVSNMLIFLFLFVYNSSNLFITSLLYFILIIVIGLFFNWFNDFLDFTKFRYYKNHLIIAIFTLLIIFSTLININYITSENEIIKDYVELGNKMENLSINRFFLGDENISAVYSYLHKRPVANIISDNDNVLVKDYNSRKINADKLYLLNKYDIEYIDETFYYNDPYCLIPVVSYESENINKTIYKVSCQIRGIKN
ncbi:MAG: hypothetical protein PHT94_01310 [Candidatus Nanoarchaeia archaeon]|nr:hypothetical protein [Candidatus Nanoarchaeia archaeon]